MTNNLKENNALKEILKWQRLVGQELLKKKIRDEKLFLDEGQILAYYHSDGEKSSRDLAKITGVGYKTIQALSKKWILAGLAEPSEKYGGSRAKRLFELYELGLEMPSVKELDTKDTSIEELKEEEDESGNIEGTERVEQEN